jgi:hypothetical protein
VRPLPQLRHSAAMMLALCLALGGILQAGQWFADPDSSQSQQRPRDHSTIALGARAPHARSTTLHRSTVLALKGSAAQDAALTQVSMLLPDRQAPVPPSCNVAPRSGRAPPLSL